MTSNRETPRKNSHRRIKKKKKKKQMCETHFLNSATRWNRKVHVLNSHQLLIPSTCVQYISPRLCCAAAPGGDCVFRLPTYSPLFKLSRSLRPFLFPFHKAPRGRNIKSSVALAAAPFRVCTSTQVPAPTVQPPISHASHPDV